MLTQMQRIYLPCLVAALGLSLMTAQACHAADKPAKQIALEPDEAGPDYLVQGEYVGNAGDAKLAAQVIAMGNGTFQAVFFHGGLPGAGWDGKDRHEVSGATKDGKTTFAGDWSAVITDKTMTGKTPAGQSFTLNKVMRKSDTLGAKPPEGAIVLFDGTSTDHFKNGKMDDRKLLMAGAETKDTFGSFTLHIEFRTPFKPFARGQARGNSGLYLQRRYEVQVLDSFGLKGVANECGGLYRQKPPDVNMCLPPLTWQTYDIDFTAAKFDDSGKRIKPAVITVRHNGVLIHDQYELKNKTGAGRKEGPQPGPILLQNHGNPVVYRNFWIVKK